jgi:hypothetical protein
MILAGNAPYPLTIYQDHENERRSFVLSQVGTVYNYVR